MQVTLRYEIEVPSHGSEIETLGNIHHFTFTFHQLLYNSCNADRNHQDLHADPRSQRFGRNIYAKKAYGPPRLQFRYDGHYIGLDWLEFLFVSLNGSFGSVVLSTAMERRRGTERDWDGVVCFSCDWRCEVRRWERGTINGLHSVIY